MLRAMRRNTKWIMLIVALAFVGLMVFQWGMDISGSSSPQLVGEVGRVNGTTINYQVWTRTYRNVADQARLQKGSALNDLEIDYVEEQAWNQLVTRILIDQELRRRGIEVTDEEVRLAFQTSPPPWLVNNELFQTGGQFDFDKYRGFFAGPSADPALLLQIEEYYRDILPRSRLMEQVATGIYVPDSELWALYRDRSEQVRIDYIMIDPEIRVADSEVTVTDEELRQYYDENREEFAQPALAEVTMVSFSRAAGAADSATALERVNSIREQLTAGADFAELASANSSDRASATAGGDLGWFDRGAMVPAFEAAAFALEPGDISEPVLSRFGYHIILVHEREDDRVHASHILIPVELGGVSEDELLGTVDRFETIALRQGLDAAADSVSIASARITLAQGSDFVPGLGQFRPLYEWAFHDSTSLGELSPIYETGDGFYAFELVSITPEGHLSFEDALPSLQRRLLLQKKKETAGWLAEQMAEELALDKTLAEVAAEHGLAVQSTNLFSRLDFVPGLGQSNDVIGAAFGLEVNTSDGPLEADDRFFIIHLVQRILPNRPIFEASKNDFRAQLVLQRQQSAIDEWLADLRERADIEDWRLEVFVPGS
jgi:peptidyl-prolyl cis-trans isomerase D